MSGAFLVQKRPVFVQALPFTDDVTAERILQWSEGKVHDVRGADGEVSYLAIETLEGTMTADLGDWIIRGVEGEYYPCKPGIFEKTYEVVKWL